MASPQKENGYTPIANEIMDELAKSKITGQEFRLIMHILRNTYGYSRKEYTASLSKIGQVIGMNRIVVKKTSDMLLSRKVIGVTPGGNSNPSTYWINKDYDSWCYPIRLQQGVTAGGNKAVTAGGNKLKILPIDENNKSKKKKRKKEKYNFRNFSEYPNWLDMALFFEFCDAREKLKNGGINSDRAVNGLLNKLKGFVDVGYTQEQVIDEAITGNWKSFYEPKLPPAYKGTIKPTTYAQKQHYDTQLQVAAIRKYEDECRQENDQCRDSEAKPRLERKKIG